MNINVNKPMNVVVRGVTRGGASGVPLPGSVVPQLAVPHGVGVVFDSTTGQGNFTAPATVGVDTLTVTDANGKLPAANTSLSYVLDPNEVIGFYVTITPAP